MKVRFFGKHFERATGIEPAKPSAWKADVQPFTPRPHNDLLCTISPEV